MGKQSKETSLVSRVRDKVLVVGGAGYIGSHTAKALAAKYDVVVYDNLSRGHEWAVKWGKLVRGCLLETDKLKALLTNENILGVFHFAASSLVGESVQNPLMYWENNVAGTASLLKAMRDSDVKHFVFSSSAAVYGEPETVPITEDFAKAPTNPYGNTKLTVENMLADCRRAHGLSYSALRYFNAAGASKDGDIGEDHTPESHLIPIILDGALGRREGVKIFGDDYPTRDGTCIRDYIHVTDLADAHVLAFEKLRDGKEEITLNLGNGTGYSVKEVVDMVRKVTKIDVRADAAPRRAGDPAQLVASSERAMKELEWKPRFASLEDIVSTAWAFHRKHFG